MTSSLRIPRSRGKTENFALTDSAADTFAFLARPWMPQLLFLLGQRDARYSEIRQVLPTLSSRVLTERLRELCEVGLAVRVVPGNQPSKVLYSLTDDGQGLAAGLNLIGQWADTTMEGTGQGPDGTVARHRAN